MYTRALANTVGRRVGDLLRLGLNYFHGIMKRHFFWRTIEPHGGENLDVFDKI
jgi:hypothetical protein